MFNFFNKSLIIFFIFLLISSIVFTSFLFPSANIFSEEYYNFYNINLNEVISNSQGYFWPLPHFKNISSYFGLRHSPTLGASSYHQGIDIPAPEKSYIVSITNAIVTFVGFNGGGRIFHNL